MNRVTTGHVQLDDPDDHEDDAGPEFPAIKPMTFTDSMSGATATFSVAEDDDPALIVTYGQPTDEVFTRFRLAIPEDFLFQLAGDFIRPLRDYRERENEHVNRQIQAEREQAEATLATYAFRAGSTGVPSTGREYELRVHLRDCHHALDTRLDKGRRGTSGTFGRATSLDDLPLGGAADVIRMLGNARTALEWCYSPRGIESNARRAAQRSGGRRRDTALDYQPVRFCGTCKPLGERTADINATLRDLSNLTKLNDAAEHTTAITFEAIEQALWQAEQAHLDTLRGQG